MVSAVDKSGRMADRHVIRAMGWAPGTRLSIREHAGTIAVSPAPDGVHRIDDRGYLLLPLAVRRWCHLAAGDRLLLAAGPAAGVLVGTNPDVHRTRIRVVCRSNSPGQGNPRMPTAPEWPIPGLR